MSSSQQALVLDTDKKKAWFVLAAHWDLPAVLAIFLLLVGITEYQVLQYTHGVFAYPLDDTFIHMAIAKNLAFHGTWGISDGVFTSASSSVIYPLLLATTFKLFGANTSIPFWLNLLAGIGFIVALWQWLRRQAMSPGGRLLVLLAALLLTPLPLMVMFGMEHTLQVLVCFMFIYKAADALQEMARPGNIHKELPWTVYLYGLLVVSTRYEGMFIVAMVCVLLFTRRRWLLSVQLGLVSLLPILIFGLVSLSKGSYFFPNSVLLKSAAPPLTVDGIGSFVTSGIFDKLYFTYPTPSAVTIQTLLLALPLVYLLFAGSLRKTAAYRYILFICTAIVFLHIVLASTMWNPFRYEAYLVGCSVPIIGLLLVKYGADAFRGQWAGAARWMAVFMLLVLLWPSFLRGRDAFQIARQACINIYEQQYQMGRFLQQYYNTTPVAIGDIGAVSFLSEGKKLDLEGLGNLDITRAKRGHYWSPAFAYQLCQKEGIKIAIVFDRSYSPQLRDRWSKIAAWQIPNNVICYSSVVSFYAVDSSYAAGLKANLQAFETRLPRDVAVQYY